MQVSRRSLLAGAALAGPAAGAPEKTLIIDAHCHAGLGERMSAPWETKADVEVTLRHMEEAGIDRTIVFPINNPTYEKANEAIAELCDRHPDKFIGFAKHDPETEGKRIPAMLRREVEKLGLKGLKLHVLPPRYVLDTVAELGIPVLYHPEQVWRYHMIAEEYPQISFIMAHLGSWGSRVWTEHIAAIDVAKRYPNVYVDTSGVLIFRYLEMAVRELGPDKVIFGSDGPEVDSRVELYKIRLLKLPPQDEAKILGGNVRRLLPPGTV